MRRWLRLAGLASAVMAIAVLGGRSPAALAGGGNAIINDCQSTGKLSRSYTLQELRHALAVMPASVKQYTSCYDVITQGILTVNSGKKTGPTGAGGGGSFLPTPVIILLVLLILAAITFGAIAVRQRRSGRGGSGSGAGEPGDGGEPPPGGGASE